MAFNVDAGGKALCITPQSLENVIFDNVLRAAVTWIR